MQAPPSPRLLVSCRAVVLANILFTLLTVWWRVGLDHTPYDARDTAGRTMGFNDRFSGEHYWIALQNFRFSAVTPVEALLVAAEALGLVLLANRRRISVPATYHLLQAALFVSPGVLGALTAWSVFPALFTGRADRETFIDVPSLVFTACYFWAISSFFVGFALLRHSRRPRRS